MRKNKEEKWLRNLLPFASIIVCTKVNLDKANREFLFCIQTAGYYREVALKNIREYSKNESNAYWSKKLESKNSYLF